MLILIFFYFLITFTCLWSGFVMVNIFARKQEAFIAKHWIVYACWGVISISFVAQIVALFMPVNQVTWLAFIVFLLIVSFLRRNVFLHFLKWITIAKKKPLFRFYW